MQNPASSPIHVYFALLPGSLVLDLSLIHI